MKHGLRSAEFVAERKLAMQTRRKIRELVSRVESTLAVRGSESGP